MSFRDEESVNDEIALILRSMARTMKLWMTDDGENYTMEEFELDMREYVLQAYRSGYYDGKRDTVQFLLANGYVKEEDNDSVRAKEKS